MQSCDGSLYKTIESEAGQYVEDDGQIMQYRWQTPSRTIRQRRIRMMLFVLAIATLGAVALVAAQPYNLSGSAGPLTFTPNGTFQISVFEDLHFGENAWDDWGPLQDLASQKVMNNILDAESQQLVVLNGDLITGENAFLENSTVYIDQIVQPLVERKLLWASTYGNHDSQYNLSTQAMLVRERTWPNARTASMVHSPDAGVSNYYLPVFPANCRSKGCKPELLLWFFDSRGGFYFQSQVANHTQIGRPNWVDQSVVDWFQLTSAKLTSKHGKTIPSMAFVHIPTYASLAAQKQNLIHPHYEPGINDDYLLAPQAQGWCANGTNGCDYGGQDIPFMQALVNTPGLMAIFSGHDHGDSWCYPWKDLLPGMTVAGTGLKLCFGQRSGYGGYGNWIRGSRQIYLTKDMLAKGELATWIRYENKSVSARVLLNASYGTDWYPKTKNRMTHLSDIYP